MTKTIWGGILFALSFPTLVTWIYFVALREYPSFVQQAAYTIGKIVQFTFPLACLLAQRRLLWRGSPREQGKGGALQDAPPGGQGTTHLRSHFGLGLGAAFGLLVASAMLCVYFFVLKPTGFFTIPGEAVRLKIAGLGFTKTWQYALLGVFYAVCHSFLEEYYWRWFVFRELKQVTSVPTAITVSSLGFMSHHVLVLATFFGWASPATWLFSAGIAIGGAVWAWLYEVTDSLAVPWLGHCLVDAAIFVVGYDLARDMFQG